MSKCTEFNIRKSLYAYELGLLSDEERNEFEIHLIECDHCFEEAVTLKDTIALIRNNQKIKDTITNLSEPELQKEINDTKIVEISSPQKPYFNLKNIIIAALIILTIILKPWRFNVELNDHVYASENRLTILLFDNISNQETYDWYREGIANLLITDLAESDYLQLVSIQRLQDILKDMGIDSSYTLDFDVAQKAAHKANSKWMLMGNFMRDNNELYLSTQLIDVETGIVISTQQVQGPSDETIFSLVDKLSVKIKEDLDLPVKVLNEPDPKISELTTRSEKTYKLYLEGIENIGRFYHLSAQQQLKKVIQADSNFAMAYYYLSQISQGDDVLYYAEEAYKRSGNASKKDKLYIQSRLATLHRDHAKAIRLLEQIIEKYPDDKEAYYTLALKFKYFKKYDQAIEYLNKAIQIDSHYDIALNQLAYIYSTNGEFEKSIETIDKYIALAPEEPNPYDSKGEILLANQKIDLAISAFEKALEKNPQFSYSLLSLIRLHLYLANFDQANELITRLFDKKIQIFEEDKIYYKALLSSYQGQFDKTLTVLDSIEDMDDLTSQGANAVNSKHILKAQIYVEKKDYQSAIREFELLFSTGNNIQEQIVTVYMADYLMTLCDAGMINKAYHIADSCLINLQSADEHLMKDLFYGVIEFKTDNYSDAINRLQKFLKSDDSRRVKMILALAYLEYGKNNQAITLLSDLQNNYEISRSFWSIQDVMTNYYLGIAYYNIKNNTEAISQFEIFLDKWKNGDKDIAEIIIANQKIKNLRNNL